MLNISKEEENEIQIQFFKETGYQHNQALNGYIWWLEEKLVKLKKLNLKLINRILFDTDIH